MSVSDVSLRRHATTTGAAQAAVNGSRRWLSRARRVIQAAVLIALVAWLVLLRPQMLGGPAAYILVAGVSMEPNLHAGDLAIVTTQPSYAAGDVVAYRVPQPDPAAGRIVIHRVIGGSGDSGFVLQGDNTSGPDMWRPTTGDVVGRMLFFIPDAGSLIAFIRSPLLLALIAASLTAGFVLHLLRPQVAEPMRTNGL